VQEIDWKDMYEKEKRRSEMWIAKYEKDIGPLEKAGPVAAQPEQEPVQVSPLEFVTMVIKKEHLIGKPLFWAEWPNKEKNT